jgi:hypothetical protein
MCTKYSPIQPSAARGKVEVPVGQVPSSQLRLSVGVRGFGLVQSDEIFFPGSSRATVPRCPGFGRSGNNSPDRV